MLFAFVSTPVLSFADDCGLYDFSGVPELRKKDWVLVLDRNTRSEVILKVDADLTPALQYYEGKEIKVRALLAKPMIGFSGEIQSSRKADERAKKSGALLAVVQRTDVGPTVLNPLNPQEKSRTLIEKRPCQ